MKKRFIFITTLVVVIVGGLGAAFYLDAFTSAEVKLERHLKKGREHMAQAKVNEAVFEFRNALKAIPSSAEAHYELGLALQ